MWRLLALLFLLSTPLVESQAQQTDVYRPPAFTIHEIGEISSLAERKPEFLTKRNHPTDGRTFQDLKRVTGNGKGIKVGVGDTGVDRAHLEGDLLNVDESKDFTRSRFGFYDRNGHGSHVTCHIGAKRDAQGIEGIASDCTLYHAKVLGDNGSGTSKGISDGIDWLVKKKCKIINLSLGGGFSKQIENACIRANKAGVLVFAALGNDGNRGDGHPGNSKYTIGVAAVDYNLRIAGFSSRSGEAILSGYGVNVDSCWLSGRHADISGTSMATPDQAGIAALMCGYCEKLGKPILNNKDYFQRIKPHIRDLGTAGWDRAYGHGFFDIWSFIDANPLPDNPVELEPDPEPPVECDPEEFLQLKKENNKLKSKIEEFRTMFEELFLGA